MRSVGADADPFDSPRPLDGDTAYERTELCPLESAGVLHIDVTPPAIRKDQEGRQQISTIVQSNFNVRHVVRNPSDSPSRMNRIGEVESQQSRHVRQAAESGRVETDALPIALALRI